MMACEICGVTFEPGVRTSAVPGGNRVCGLACELKMLDQGLAVSRAKEAREAEALTEAEQARRGLTGYMRETSPEELMRAARLMIPAALELPAGDDRDAVLRLIEVFILRARRLNRTDGS